MRQVGDYCGNSGFGVFVRRRSFFSDSFPLAAIDCRSFGRRAGVWRRSIAKAIFGKCVIARPDPSDGTGEPDNGRPGHEPMLVSDVVNQKVFGPTPAARTIWSCVAKQRCKSMQMDAGGQL